MAAPTVTEIRNELEGYGITASVVSDAWIENKRDNVVIPHIEEITGMTFDQVSTITEWYNGYGGSTLILNRKPIVAVTEIIEVGSLTEGNLLGAVETIPEEGILKVKNDFTEGIYGPIFRRGTKNIKVTYTYGTDDYPAKVAQAIILMVAAKILNHVGARTGGGGITVQAFGRNYGSHGKYTDIRREMVAEAYSLLKPYMTSVSGS